MDLILKILTLNCWGIPQPYPIGSKDRGKRMAAIADKLAASDYDIVSLQELWSQSDYEMIKGKVAEQLPYSFYFHSGFLGSGVAIYARGPIVDTLMHRYSLNGYPHHVHRGDWFGGKVVGLARIRLNNLLINVYATHIHAEYDRVNDLYLPHRVVQAYELAQFVRGTSGDADLTVVMGDLNLESTDLGHKIILANANLKDSWMEREDSSIPAGSDPFGNTCDIPANSYVSKASLLDWPNGKRIDYILYAARKGLVASVKQCYTVMGRIPTEEISYSDHEAVRAEIRVLKAESGPETPRRKVPTLNLDQKLLMEESVGVIDRGIGKVSSDRRFFIAALVVLATVFVYTIDLELHHPQLTLAVLMTRFLLTLVIGFCCIYGFVGLEIESKAYLAAKSGIQVLLDSYIEESSV